MKKNIYTIYDEKAQAWLQPFFLGTDMEATRAMQDCLSDPDHNFSRHPSDYSLFNTGTFDNATGRLEIGTRISLGSLVEFKRPPLSPPAPSHEELADYFKQKGELKK